MSLDLTLCPLKTMDVFTVMIVSIGPVSKNHKKIELERTLRVQPPLQSLITLFLNRSILLFVNPAVKTCQISADARNILGPEKIPLEM